MDNTQNEKLDLNQNLDSNLENENNLLDANELKNVIEAILFTQGKDMEVKEIARVIKDGLIKQYGEEEVDFSFLNKKNIENALNALLEKYNSKENQSIELVNTAMGYRFQASLKYKDFLQCLSLEKPPKYSKAVLETLAIIAYRQPITRAEIEVIRGVAVSSEVIKKLLDREWINVIGHKEVPGRPAVYASTKTFLADLGLQRLEDLPVFTKEEDKDSDNNEIIYDDNKEVASENIEEDIVNSTEKEEQTKEFKEPVLFNEVNNEEFSDHSRKDEKTEIVLTSKSDKSEQENSDLNNKEAEVV